MNTLTIQDLAVTAELDTQSMASVRGGFCGWPQVPICGYPSSLTPSSSTVTTDLKIAQANNQFQSNATGNGSAVFCGSISAYNNQQGFNSVG